MQNPIMASQTRCPATAEGCREIVRPRLFKKFVPQQFSRYLEFIGRTYTEHASGVAQCPAPDCTSVARLGAEWA